MIRIDNIEVYSTKNDGCNNGNYPSYTMWITDTKTGEQSEIHGVTCACRKGCSNTDRLPKERDEFLSLSELYEFMES